jgi:hypothetical protein
VIVRLSALATSKVSLVASRPWATELKYQAVASPTSARVKKKIALQRRRLNVCQVWRYQSPL